MADPLRPAARGFLETALLLLLCVPALAYAGWRLKVGAYSVQNAVLSFQRPGTLVVLLVLSASVLVGRTLATLGDGFSGLLLTALLGATVLWLLVLRDPIDTELTLLVGTWAACLFLALENIQRLTHSVEIGSAAWLTRFFVFAHWGVLSALLLAPPVLFRSGVRDGSRRKLDWLLRRAPQVSLAALAGIAILAVANFWPGRDPLKTDLVLTALSLPLILALCGSGLAVIRSTTRGSLHNRADMKPKSFRLLIVVILITYAILGARIAIMQRDQLGLDGIGHLQIARAYAAGHPVIRGNLAPLISWLTAPAVAIGVDPVDSIRGLEWGLGLAWILLTDRLARRFGLARLPRLGLAVAMLATSLTNAFVPATADILGSVVLLGYFMVALSPPLLDRPLQGGIVAGALGSFAYFAKYYNLPFVVAHVAAMALLYTSTGYPRRRAAAFVVSALGTIGIMAAP